MRGLLPLLTRHLWCCLLKSLALGLVYQSLRVLMAGHFARFRWLLAVFYLSSFYEIAACRATLLMFLPAAQRLQALHLALQLPLKNFGALRLLQTLLMH